MKRKWKCAVKRKPQFPEGVFPGSSHTVGGLEKLPWAKEDWTKIRGRKKLATIRRGSRQRIFRSSWGGEANWRGRESLEQVEPAVEGFLHIMSLFWRHWNDMIRVYFTHEKIYTWWGTGKIVLFWKRRGSPGKGKCQEVYSAVWYQQAKVGTRTGGWSDSWGTGRGCGITVWSTGSWKGRLSEELDHPRGLSKTIYPKNMHSYVHVVKLKRHV